MELTQITKGFNKALAGEMYTYSECVHFLDQAIDDINTRLNTQFPAFSELPEGAAVYDALPDKYIRTVIIPGAAFYFYTMDEEGASVAPKYEEIYKTNLYYIERDYLALVPPEYLADLEQGTIDFEANEGEPRGLSLGGYYGSDIFTI